ncbi:uncharacterized mitochondrial protein-like protein [Tanacetum coccineum]
MWEAIKSRNLGADRVKKARLQTLIKEFENLKMSDNDCIDAYAAKLSGIASKSATLGEVMSEHKLVKKFLTSLPRRFVHIVAALEQVLDLKTTGFEDVVGRLKANSDSSRGRGRGSYSRGRGRGRGQGRGRGNSQNQGQRDSSKNREDNRQKGKQKEQRDLSHIKCYRCDKFGHFVLKCPDQKRDYEANLSETHEGDVNHEEGTFFMMNHIQETIFMNEEKYTPPKNESNTDEDDVWYFDNGASNHMTGNYSYFSELNENITGRIKFGDGSCVRIKGKGSILFQGKNGEQKLLVHAQLKVGKPYCLQANIDEESWLWHVRLGHIGFGAVNLMHKLAKEVPVIKHQDQVCESCMVGKQTKKSFSKKATYRASKILEMVHADICGPITPSTQADTVHATVPATVHATVPATVAATVTGQNSHATIYSPQTPATGTYEDDYEEDDVAIPVRHSTHNKVLPTRLVDYQLNVHELMLTLDEEPRNYNEAKLKPQWLKAMKTELESIVKNNTWKLIPLPKGVVPIRLKWLFKIKRNADGSIMKYKARLVAKGYAQQPGIDFDKVFALDCVEIKQERYAKNLKEAGMEDCNATLYPMEKDLKLSKVEDEPEVEATQYRKVVGCLRYLLHTRPDLTYSVGVVSRYMQSPRESHARAIKQILRYLKGTTSFGIKYNRSNDMKLVGYSDSSHNVDIDDGRSTTGHVFYLGTSPITWCSQKQTTVALSSCEAEFMAATAAACQAIWLRELLAEVTGLERQKSKKQVTPNPPEGGSKATSEGDWIKVQKKGSFQVGWKVVVRDCYEILKMSKHYVHFISKVEVKGGDGEGEFEGMSSGVIGESESVIPKGEML